MKKGKGWSRAIVLAVLLACAHAGPGYAGGPGGLFTSDNDQWGGYVKLRSQMSRIDDRSFYQPVGTGTYIDYGGQARVTYRHYFSDSVSFDAHYEVTAAAGDTIRKQNELAARFPDLAAVEEFNSHIPNDRRRLLNLSADMVEEDDYVVYHRIDRLSLTLQQPWGDLRIGRQALTWGNGLLFNPMDLFNPFAPTDIEREYKIGDDMISATIASGDMPEIQVLIVPRRDPATGSIEAEQSALAAKVHLIRGETEFDLLAAANHGDRVLGAGARGNLGNAAWRIDAVYTAVDPRLNADDFVSLVANMDYSWTWWDRNWYGFIEFYHNGPGRNDYSAAFSDADLLDRLNRGEVFVLGEWYGAVQARVELHPLVNAYVTEIVNLHDPSGLLQPRVTWDATQNLTVTLGANLYWGADQTEYGGFSIPGTAFEQIPADSVYIWGSWYF